MTNTTNPNHPQITVEAVLDIGFGMAVLHMPGHSEHTHPEGIIAGALVGGAAPIAQTISSRTLARSH